jgi:hypothetical protein
MTQMDLIEDMQEGSEIVRDFQRKEFFPDGTQLSEGKFLRRKEIASAFPIKCGFGNQFPEI